MEQSTRDRIDKVIDEAESLGWNVTGFTVSEKKVSLRTHGVSEEKVSGIEMTIDVECGSQASRHTH